MGLRREEERARLELASRLNERERKSDQTHSGTRRKRE